MKKLEGQNVTVFDLEIKEEINQPGPNPIGWKDYDRMGISVGVAFSFKTMSTHVFLDDNIHELVALLCSSDMVTGFNIEDFDLPLLFGQTMPDGTKFSSLMTNPFVVYDPLKYMRKAIAGKAEAGRFLKGLRLDDHLLGTFGREAVKIGHGSEAPRWYKAGRMGKLITYCIDDVQKEARLFREAWEGRPITTPNFGPRMLDNPQQFMPAQTTFDQLLGGNQL